MPQSPVEWLVCILIYCAIAVVFALEGYALLMLWRERE